MSTLFVSHGAPNLILHNSEARHFLEKFGKNIGKPRAILMVTAHFEAHRPTLTNGAQPPMIYDFGGFEPELRTVHYRAPGSPEVARSRPHACPEWRKEPPDRRTSFAALRGDGGSG